MRNMRRLLIRQPYSCGSEYSFLSDKKACNFLIVSQQPVVSLSNVVPSQSLVFLKGAQIAVETPSRIFSIPVVEASCFTLASPLSSATAFLRRVTGDCKSCCKSFLSVSPRGGISTCCHGCHMAIAGFLDRMWLALRASGLSMAPLGYAAKFDPFLSLDCAPTPAPSTLVQSKERKGSNFAI